MRLSSSSLHAVTNTPTESQAALFVRFTCDCGLPRITGGSASVSPFSRPAQCSHNITACRVAKFLEEPSTPKASDDSLPPRLLRLLPVGTKVTGRDSHPLKNSALPRRTIKGGYHRSNKPPRNRGVVVQLSVNVIRTSTTLANHRLTFNNLPAKYTALGASDTYALKAPSNSRCSLKPCFCGI